MTNIFINSGYSVITIDDTDYKVDQNREFKINEESYTIFDFTTTLVKHKKGQLSDIETKYFDVPFIIKKDDAIKIITDIANLTQFQLQISNSKGTVLGSSDGLINTLRNQQKAIFDCLKKIILLHHNHLMV